jgi:hypothetical protein
MLLALTLIGDHESDMGQLETLTISKLTLCSVLIPNYRDRRFNLLDSTSFLLGLHLIIIDKLNF